MKILMVLLYIFHMVSSQIYSAKNANFTFQNGIWLNSMDGMNLPAHNDHQKITNQINNTILIDFGWTFNASNEVILGNPFYQQTKYFPLRIDNDQALLYSFSLTLNSSLLNTLYMNASFIFQIVSNNSISSIGVSTYKITIGTYQSNMLSTGQLVTSSILLNNSTFILYSNPIIYANTIMNSNGSLITYDFNQFFQDLLKHNLISPNDYIVSFKLQFDIYGGSANITYHQDFPYSTYHYYNDKVFSYDNSNISLYLFNKNFTSTDYCNVTFVDGSTELNNLILDYYFPTISNNLKASVGITYGYINNTWVTPINTNSLPIPVNSNYSINTAYSFNHFDYNISNERIASCWVILISSHYNPHSQVFTANNHNPSREIYVCPYWTSSLTIDATFITTVLYNKTIMFQYIGTSQSSDFQYSCPSHTFIYQNNTLNPRQIDLKAFVRWIYNSHNLSNQSDYVVGMQYAFRMYSGKGNFSYINQSTVIVNITNTSNEMNTVIKITTNIASNTTSNRTQVTTIFSNQFISNCLLGAFSSPSIKLLVQAIRPFTDLMDQFSYYNYHKRNYSIQISAFYDLVNSLMNNQWIPSFIQNQLKQYYLNYLDYSSVVLRNDYNKSTSKILQAGQDIYFIKNIQYYLISSLPISVILFLILMLVYKGSRISAIRKLLQNFSEISFLSISIVGDNIQYLSFWGFTQFYFIVPIGIIGNINLIITVMFIYITLIYAIAGFIIMRCFIRSQLKIVIEGQIYSFNTLMFISITFLIKFTNGFIHGFLYYNSLSQIILLFMTNCAYLMNIVRYRKTFKSPILYYALIIEWLLKIAMHILFIYEYFLIMNNKYTQDQNIKLGTIELYFIYLIISMSCIRFLYSITKSLIQFYNSHTGTTKEKQLKEEKPKTKNKSNRIKVQHFHFKNIRIGKILKSQEIEHQHSEVYKLRQIKKTIFDPHKIIDLRIIHIDQKT